VGVNNRKSKAEGATPKRDRSEPFNIHLQSQYGVSRRRIYIDCWNSRYCNNVKALLPVHLFGLILICMGRKGGGRELARPQGQSQMMPSSYISAFSMGYLELAFPTYGFVQELQDPIQNSACWARRIPRLSFPL
jgi:hypothetical protein